MTDEFKMCTKCGKHPATHNVYRWYAEPKEEFLCCKCNALDETSDPADWHHGCVAAWKRARKKDAKKMKKAPDMVDNRPRIRWDSAVGHFWCSGNGMLAAGNTPDEAYKSYTEMAGEISMFGMSFARIMQSEEKVRA